MKEYELVEQAIRQFHKYWFAEYIAKVLEIEYRIYGNRKSNSYNEVYNRCFDTIIYNLEERKEIYELVDDILTDKYRLLIANCADKEDSIYLVDLDESEEN